MSARRKGRSQENVLIDRVARYLWTFLGTPAGRDVAGVFFVGCMVAAIALWKPLLGLFVLGVAGLAVTVLVSFLATRPVEREDVDGTG